MFIMNRMYTLLIILCSIIVTLNSLCIISHKRKIAQNSEIYMSIKNVHSSLIPIPPSASCSRNTLKLITSSMIVGLGFYQSIAVNAADDASTTTTIVDSVPIKSSKAIDFRSIRIPYNHVNLELKDFLGEKATIVFNMKIDDPQTVLQFPDLLEIYKRYKSLGLNVLAFPTEQGWFEPDDDETCRAKAKEYYGFGDYPNAVVFDKV